MTLTPRRDIKIDSVPDINDNRICGAVSKYGDGICSQTAGWRTNHPGVGRCYWHEDTIETVKITDDVKLQIPSIEERMNKFLNDGNILSLDREIALCRSYIELFERQLELLKDENIRKIMPEDSRLSIPQLTDAIVRVTANIGKLVRTKSDIEVGRKYVVHINIFQSMVAMIAEIVNNQVGDIETKKNILNEFAKMSLPSPE